MEDLEAALEQFRDIGSDLGDSKAEKKNQLITNQLVAVYTDIQGLSSFGL